uniref:Uncharacterized protein n=1 Tax=Graphocephala atropunctata TaxID=36148 RepID=A0A1B6K9A9_9HEMI
MKLSCLAIVVTVVLCSALCGETVLAWFFSDDHEPRQLDGSLRCYQCDSKDRSTCTLGNWKHANVTEKRNMIMQCPRKKSAFCHLILTENSNATVRGCSGPTYSDKDEREAHIGCFSMIKPESNVINRVCLCDTLLCNPAVRPRASVSVCLFIYTILVLCFQLFH